MIDKLQVLYGDDYHASSKVVVKHPTVGDIKRAGEDRYWALLSILTAIPSDMKYPLFEKGIDYMEISDFELFAMLVHSIQPKDSELFFLGMEFSNFNLYRRQDGEVILYDPVNDVVIDRLIHKRIADFLCGVFRIKKEVEMAGNAFTKKILIEEDRERRERASGREFKSSLLPLISAMVNSKGFKYNYEEVLKMPYGQFMDAVMRVQTITSVDQMAYGYFTGSFDVKKFDVRKQLDWMRDLDR